MNKKEAIEQGNTWLGIEFGSTRIKAVLIGEDKKPIAAGSYGWENQYEQGVWTYHMDMIWKGLQECYADLLKNVKDEYQVSITTFKGIGFSAMMHGYLAFDQNDQLLVPFRTWRNTMTGQAAEELTKAFDYNIPQRWSIAHLYQAILNKEEHVKDIAFFTTLAGFIHWQLTGEKVLGVGDASGMFPINPETKDYEAGMLEKFESLVEPYGFGWNIKDILPKVLVAGENAGTLTEAGAKLLDVSGNLQAGIPVCPPEGDAGTGMTATNSVAKRTGNVSAGTSVFAMIVLDQKLKKVHPEIDLVTTPSGELVAMVHCNNCTSEINAWAKLFTEMMEAMGQKVDVNQLYTTLFEKALEGNADCGGLMGYNYFSGEPVTGFEEGRPMFYRSVNADFTLGNFMRMQLYTAVGALKAGLDILFQEEEVQLDKMFGHGGFFKTPKVGQQVMAAAMDAPVTVMETAGEGGAWGIAVLAAYETEKENNETLDDYLINRVFAGEEGTTIAPEQKEVEGFNQFMKVYKAGFGVEQAAIQAI